MVFKVHPLHFSLCRHHNPFADTNEGGSHSTSLDSDWLAQERPQHSQKASHVWPLHHRPPTTIGSGICIHRWQLGLRDSSHSCTPSPCSTFGTTCHREWGSASMTSGSLFINLSLYLKMKVRYHFQEQPQSTKSTVFTVTISHQNH